MELSRSAVFDLVWSEPRTTLALRLGISDVALAKKCRMANVPMPPRGYWAKVSGRRKLKPPLPLRMPGQPETISFHSKSDSDERTADTVPSRPCFSDDVETLVDAACGRLGRLKAQRDLVDVHTGLTQLLAKESKRRAEYQSHGSQWSHLAPHFDDPLSQRQLRLCSALFRGFDRLGVKGHASEDSAWTQGVGTTYRLAASLNFHGTVVPFHFTQSGGRAKDGQLLALTTGGNRSGTSDDSFSWIDSHKLPLEKQLDRIARGLLTCAERSLRASEEYAYQWKLNTIERTRREISEHQRKIEAEHQAQIDREQQVRRDGLYKLVSRRQLSVDIRLMIGALKAQRPDLSESEEFTHWCQFALEEADRLDPMFASLCEVVGSTTASPSPAGRQHNE